jgi:predicted ATPase
MPAHAPNRDLAAAMGNGTDGKLSSRRCGRRPELFAQHYAEAGLVEKSVAYWGKAGHRSAARSAMAEAVAQFQRGLDQLALSPRGRERERQELEYYSALGALLIAVKGRAAPETGQAYEVVARCPHRARGFDT